MLTFWKSSLLELFIRYNAPNLTLAKIQNE